MFEEAKTLLVVYKDKDEVVLNQLKKMIQTKDDTAEGEIVGVEDGTVEIVAWNEKLYLQNKKAGNVGDINSKILFIGDIKGTENLQPVLDIKFNKYGVSYGIAGNQILLDISEKALFKKSEYEAFLAELKEITDIKLADTKKKMSLKNPWMWGKIGVFAFAPWLLGLVAGGALGKDVFEDKALVRHQMMLYGIIQLYMSDLDSFMKA